MASETTHLQWLKNKIFNKEALSMCDFATTFKYFSETDAEEAFESLLSKSIVPQARQAAALNQYEIWKRNEGPLFWATQSAALSLTQTAGELVAEGTHVAKDLVRKSRISIVSSQTSAQADSNTQGHESCSKHVDIKEPKRALPKTSRLREQKTQFSSSSTSSTASPVAGATSSLSGSPVKRKRAIVRTEDPWHELTLSLTKIVNGQKTDFPLSAPSMTSAAKVLFNHAVNLLDEYQQQTPDKKDTTLIKDAQVAMSCLLNTMSPRAVNHFMFEKEEETVTDAIDSTTLSYFEEHECLAYAREYCTVLEEHGLEYLIRKLAIDRGQLFSSYPLDESLPKAVVIKEKVLRVLEKVCHFALNPPFGSLPPSENDCLQLWLEIFGIITNRVTIHSGEKVLEASKIMRNQQAVEYGDLSDSGRKVDLIFSYDKVELSNVEFKRQDISPKNITVQCRKNIRLGRCIQELHKSYGIKDPVVMMADVAGYVGFFYLVKPLKGISVAGKTTRSMAILPNTAGAMEVFLKGTSLAMIWNYLDFLERQGPKVARAKERTDAEQEMASMELAIASSHPCTPPLKERDFSNVVTFSPSRKRNQKSAGLD